MTRVAIVQELLAQYRVPFYEELRKQLLDSGIELQLIHGRATGGRASRGDEAAIDWATVVENVGVPLGPRANCVWQPVLSHTKGADLIIVEQANRLLVNYVLMSLRLIRSRSRIAFWGHGANLQSGNPTGVRETWKRWTTRWPDWWFAYTEGSAARVRAAGFPAEKISVVQNSVDTTAFEIMPLARVGHRCIYVGALDRDKRIEFLLEACRIVADSDPLFELVVAGNGPERSKIEKAAQTHPWIKYRGSLFGRDKAIAMAEAELSLMPGLVGLGVIDAFAAGTPLVTTDIPWHSPEFEYLENDTNGLVLPASSTPEDFAISVGELLVDPARLERLRSGCSQSAANLSLDAMVDRYANGVRAALA